MLVVSCVEPTKEFLVDDEDDGGRCRDASKARGNTYCQTNRILQAASSATVTRGYAGADKWARSVSLSVFPFDDQLNVSQDVD